MKIEDLAKREIAKRADERDRNRALVEKHMPELAILFDQLKEAGMDPKIKSLEFHVEQKEAA